MLQVACTALGVNHCLLKGRTFDMCIVDEAGQMTLPVALGPILHSKYGAVSLCLLELTCTGTPNTYPFACLFTLSIVHSLVYAFVCSFIYPVIRSLNTSSLP